MNCWHKVIHICLLTLLSAGYVLCYWRKLFIFVPKEPLLGSQPQSPGDAIWVDETQ